MKDSTRIKIELYRRSDFALLDVFPKQTLALSRLKDGITNEVLYGGAARGGKSWLGCLWQIMNRLSMPNSHGLIAREELTKLKDTTKKTFFNVCDWLGLVEGVDYIRHEGSLQVDFYNGSTVVFREIKYYPKDPEFDRLGSYDLTDALLDEAQQIHYKAREILRGRFSVLSGDGWSTIPKALYTCNPSKGWIYTDFYKPYELGEIPADMAFIPALPKDNPYVDESYIRNLEKADKTTRERLLYGNFNYDDNPNKLVTYDAILDCFTNDHVPYGLSYISADIALQGRDRFVAISWRGQRAEISIVKNKSNAKEVEEDIKRLKVDKAIPNTRIIADADGLGSWLSAYMSNIREFHGGAASKDDKYGNIKDECAYALARAINNREIRIECQAEYRDEIATELLTCLVSVPSDHGKLKIIPKSKQKELLGRSPDFFDALLMRYHFEVKKSYDVSV